MASAKTFTLSDKSISKTAVILPEGAGEILCEAAVDLQAILEKMTGMAPPMEPDSGMSAPSARTAIHVGRTAYARKLNLDAGDVGVEGYRIVTSGRDLFILGGSDSGTAYGVYGLLEDHLGARWFIPGEMFEDIPVQPTLRIAPINEQVRPHFLHRVFSGISRAVSINGSLEGALWERRNRVSRRRLELPYDGFHHALYDIFPVAQYGKTHPEYYALIDGKRLVPESDRLGNEHFGQPCTSNPEVVEITIQAACRFFDEHPEAHSFSLGMNDNRDFCQCPDCRALDIPGLTFRDRPVYSDRFFTYVNAVARALQKTHPGKFVGCLAYSVVEMPPQRIERLEPNVAIYLTQDTSQHFDPAYRDKDREFIRSWIEKCAHVCKYDYYGLAWMLPRYFPHLIADDVQFQHDAGVVGFYAEAYPHWPGFGPHVYLASKLWWNADLDVEKLLREFFERLFRKAAGQMRAFYDRLEEIWRRSREGRWFQGLHGIHDQVPCYTVDDVDGLEAILTRAYTASRDPLVRLRVDHIRRWFALPATLIRGWRWADEVLALPPGAEAREKAHTLRRVPARLTRAFRRAILEDRWISRSYFDRDRADGFTYYNHVEAPWKEKVEKAIAHAIEETA